MSIHPRILLAALKKNKPLLFDSALLPNCELSVHQPLGRLSAAHCRRFHEVVGWQDTSDDYLHPSYLHTQTFQQHIQLMLNKQFPFALLGLVHKSNTVQQYVPLTRLVSGVLSSKVESFVRQSRGMSCIISSQLEDSGEVLWRSFGEFLCVNKNADKPKTIHQQAASSPAYQHKQSWQCNGNLGRQYAWASGDFNPIHLSVFSARLFGFKRAVAHGMWTKARCLSHYQEQLMAQPAFSCEVGFKQPLFLPSYVDFSASETSSDQHTIQFQVTSKNSQFTHLQGQVHF